MKSRLLDPSFRYIPAANTDIRKTFERERARLEVERLEREKKVKELPPARKA